MLSKYHLINIKSKVPSCHQALDSGLLSKSVLGVCQDGHYVTKRRDTRLAPTEDDGISFSALSLDIDVKDIPSPDYSDILIPPPRTREMIFSSVGAGERVLLVWADLGPQPQLFQESVEQIQSTVGQFTVSLTSPVMSILTL